MHRKTVHVYDFQSCNACGKEFKNGIHLGTHLKNIHGKEAHACKECKKEFKTYRTMRHHIVIAHEDNLDRICHICGVLYESNYAMKKHMKSICSQRPSKRQTHIVNGKQDCSEGGYCKDCDKTFKTTRSFHMHKTTHILGPSKCCLCLFTCSDSTSLRKHFRNAHNIDKEDAQILVPTVRWDDKIETFKGVRATCKNCGKDYSKDKKSRHLRFCTRERKEQASVESILAAALPSKKHETSADSKIERQEHEKEWQEKKKEIAEADIKDVETDQPFPLVLYKIKSKEENERELVADVKDVEADQHYPQILYNSKSKEELALELGLDYSVHKNLTRDQILESLLEATLAEPGNDMNNEEEIDMNDINNGEDIEMNDEKSLHEAILSQPGNDINNEKGNKNEGTYFDHIEDLETEPGNDMNNEEGSKEEAKKCLIM